MSPRLTILSLLTLTLAACSQSAKTPPSSAPLTKLPPAIAPAQKAPPKVSLNVRDFGTKADGTTDDTLAIQHALDRAWALGGGEVTVPAGTYLVGALCLKSNTTLHLEKDALLTGSSDLSEYPVTQIRWEGEWIQGHVGMIYAIDAHDIAIIGPGKISGNKNKDFGVRPNKDKPLRNPALIEPMNCKNIRFEDFTAEYTAMWCLHPTYCENFTAKNLTIRSTGGNGDGIDVDSCKHVIIDSCDIATGDDSIALKSGRALEAFLLARPTEDVLITHCTLSDSIFACIGIGSETSGGIRNVRIEHTKFVNARSAAIFIKSNVARGAFIENITGDDLDVGKTAGFLRIALQGGGLIGTVPVPGLEGVPATKNFKFSNIHVTNCPSLVNATEIPPQKPLDGFSLINVTGTAARGLSLANMKNVVLKDINITGLTGARLGINNVTGIGLEGAIPISQPKVVPLYPANEKTAAPLK